jgi:hypothetical protein
MGQGVGQKSLKVPRGRMAGYDHQKMISLASIVTEIWGEMNKE